MKFVIASERGRLIRERKKYVDEFNSKKATYENQVDQFANASANYSTDMEQYIRTFVSSELDAIPGATLRVQKSKLNRSTATDDYYVVFKYSRPKSVNKYYSGDRYHGSASGDYIGFHWSYEIFIQTLTSSEWNQATRQYDYTYTKVLKKLPRIEANLLEADDLDTMKKTYDLFDKLETIDWQAVIDKINSSVPKRDDYITTKDPGYLDTSEYDEAITNYNIARILGKDIWIRVNITREDSYDRYSDYSTNPGVDGKGWIRVSAATPKFYTFNWLEGDNNTFDASKVDRATRRSYKMKKIYIHPIEPVEYLSTEELKNTVEPVLEEPQP